MNETTERELSVFEKHQLLIALKAVNSSDAAAAILGGPTRAEAREIIERITKAPSDAALQSASSRRPGFRSSSPSEAERARE
jgi:phage replication-related protein YjqB (UPF0714/DUF867 family)